MNWKTLRSVTSAVTLLLLSYAGASVAQAPQNRPAVAGSAPAAANTMPTDAQIADAKSKGMVWVNLNTKVYHKPDAVYGKTKNGKFMTEADAQKAGARMAKTSPVGKKKS